MTYLAEICPDDHYRIRQLERLLQAEGIRRDQNLDYSCGIFDESGELIATGSCFHNTLRCLAVDHRHRGECLMNEIITHLIGVQFERGNTHVFLYTKCESAGFFRNLGFYEIIRIPGQLVFMENRRNGFLEYLESLKRTSPEYGRPEFKVAAVVMNANPFTLGHQHLIETAASENNLVHVFVLSEESGPVPFQIRKKLVEQGTSHLKTVYCHDSGPYMISNATFPSYFQKDECAAAESHARLDISLFTRIAGYLRIHTRYVGEEPLSAVTALYNRVMAEGLAAAGLCCRVIPRIQNQGEVISASWVRRLIAEDRIGELETLVPPCTLKYFQSQEAEPVIGAIRKKELEQTEHGMGRL